MMSYDVIKEANTSPVTNLGEKREEVLLERVTRNMLTLTIPERETLLEQMREMRQG